MTLTVVIPTYNEGDIIESSLKRISEELGDLRAQTEIIIADDGTDELPEVVERCGASFGFSSISVLRNDTHLGKGDSIRRAFEVSRGDIVGFLDVDLSVGPSYISSAVREIRQGNDLCIATRVGDRFRTDGSLATSVLATTFAFIHRRLLFGAKRNFTDTQCGFKFFKRPVALDLFKNLVATDGLTDLEILLKAVLRGYAVSELEVPRINDRVGKRKLSRVIVFETLSLWRIFCKYKLGLSF